MDDVAKVVSLSGIRASLSRGMIGVAPISQLALEESEPFIREWNGGADGRITTMLGPHAPYTCAIYSFHHFARICGRLGTELKHTKPGRPQGWGKAVRFMYFYTLFSTLSKIRSFKEVNFLGYKNLVILCVFLLLLMYGCSNQREFDSASKKGISRAVKELAFPLC